MTRVLATGDWHLGAGTDHRVDALADHEAALEHILDIAILNDVDLLLHAGDIFDKPHPSIRAQHVLKRFVQKLERDGRPMIAILGNASHDQVNSATETAAEIADSPSFRVSRHAEVIRAAGISICTLPSVPVHRLVAQHDTHDRTHVFQHAADLLTRTASDLAASCEYPRVLLGHWSVEGAHLPNGLPVADLHEPVLPLEPLLDLGYDAIVMGHIHNPTPLTDGPAVYTGSPMCLNFGEAHVPHGVWIIDVEEHGYRYEEIPDRRFVTVDVDLTGEIAEHGLDDTDIIAAHLAAHLAEELPLIDTVVRVAYTATEEQHRRVDQAALLGFLHDAGAHRVYGGIKWNRAHTVRARAEHVDETLEPMEAVESWATVNALDEKRRARLADLTRDYIGSAA